MTRRWLLVFGLLLMTGCAGSFVGSNPQTRTVVLPLAERPAYDRALRTFALMGGQVRVAQGQTIAGVVHGAVELAVFLAPHAQGTAVTVTGSVLPGKLTLGRFDEVETYVQLLTQESAAHAH